MPFELIERNANAARVKPDEVWLSTSHAPKNMAGGKPKRMLRFAVGAKVAQTLGWGEDQSVLIKWGTGPDRGKVLITKTASSSTAWTVSRRNGAGPGNVRTTALPADLPERQVKNLRLWHEIVGGDLIVKLPADWLTVVKRA